MAAPPPEVSHRWSSIRGMRLMVRRVPAVVVLLLLAAAAASAQTKVNGDARAWEEVQAAFDRLGKLRSYRARITAPGVTTVGVNEGVPPHPVGGVQQKGEGPSGPGATPAPSPPRPPPTARAAVARPGPRP